MHVHFVHYEIFYVKHWSFTQRCNKARRLCFSTIWSNIKSEFQYLFLTFYIINQIYNTFFHWSHFIVLLILVISICNGIVEIACGIWLYRFLILAVFFFFTLVTKWHFLPKCYEFWNRFQIFNVYYRQTVCTLIRLNHVDCGFENKKEADIAFGLRGYL